MNPWELLGVLLGWSVVGLVILILVVVLVVFVLAVVQLIKRGTKSTTIMKSKKTRRDHE